MGTISTSKNLNDFGQKTVTLVRNELTPRVVKLTYKVRVKRLKCTEWRIIYTISGKDCEKWTPYYIEEDKKFKIKFTYTVPLKRAQSEKFVVKLTQTKISKKSVVSTLETFDTIRVYEFVKKKNKLEVYIDAVRRLDTWW